MSAAFKRIEKSLKDAIAFAEGKDVKARVYKPSQVNVKRVRKKHRHDPNSIFRMKVFTPIFKDGVPPNPS